MASWRTVGADRTDRRPRGTARRRATRGPSRGLSRAGAAARAWIGIACVGAAALAGLAWPHAGGGADALGCPLIAASTLAGSADGRGRPRFEGAAPPPRVAPDPGPREPGPLVVASEKTPRLDAGNASLATPRAGSRATVPSRRPDDPDDVPDLTLSHDQCLAASIHVGLVMDFHDVLDRAPEPARLRGQMQAILVRAAHTLSNSDAAREGRDEASARFETPSWTELRNRLSDGTIRQLGLMLPNMTLARDLAPSVSVRRTWSCGRSARTARADGPFPDDAPVTIVRYAEIDGVAREASREGVQDRADPRIESARADEAARRAEWRRTVEAVLGLRIYAEPAAPAEPDEPDEPAP